MENLLLAQGSAVSLLLCSPPCSDQGDKSDDGSLSNFGNARQAHSRASRVVYSKQAFAFAWRILIAVVSCGYSCIRHHPQENSALNDLAEFRHFRYLLAIVERKGFRAAAEHPRTAEPNLSVQAK